MEKKEYDAIVVGSGPNGFAAAILIQQQGLKTLLIEAKPTTGGGLRSAELTLPGFNHDVSSAVHPLALASPYFSRLPLAKYGLSFINPTLAAAHPFDNGQAVSLERSVLETALMLGNDDRTYERLLSPLVKSWPALANDILGPPLHLPRDPLAYARFGLTGIQPAANLIRRFGSFAARGFFAGMAAHSMLPLSHATTAAVALVLLVTGHSKGWPIPRGGSQSIANALESYFKVLGGEIVTDFEVRTLGDLPPSRAVLLDVTPRQLLTIAGNKFTPLYQSQLRKFRYGMGVFKIDWALSAPIPFTARPCRLAGTVHLGNTFPEIAGAEKRTWDGTQSERPFVLLSQPSLFDATRAPAGKHTAWAYCHIPAYSDQDVSTLIESQVERFAPGFKDLIIGRHTFNARQMEAYNANNIGGDINGGVLDIGQLFTRPALRWSPYKTSAKGIYLCSASTPPGGGVHGMCGYHAAKNALKDIFGLSV